MGGGHCAKIARWGQKKMEQPGEEKGKEEGWSSVTVCWGEAFKKVIAFAMSDLLILKPIQKEQVFGVALLKSCRVADQWRRACFPGNGRACHLLERAPMPSPHPSAATRATHTPRAQLTGVILSLSFALKTTWMQLGLFIFLRTWLKEFLKWILA